MVFGRAVLMLLFLSVGCAGAASDDQSGASDPLEEYVLSIEALKTVNLIIDLENKAHETTQDAFYTADPFSRRGRADLEVARQSWEDIEPELAKLTDEHQALSESLEAAVPVLEIALDAWARFFTEAEEEILTGGGSSQRTNHLMSVQEYAAGQTTAGMGLMGNAARELVELICAQPGGENDPACFLNSPPPQ
jgi:hypothetical protein